MNHITCSVLVSELIINGNRCYTTNDEIRNAILRVSAPMGTFITYDIHLIQKEIKNLPWIKQASVRKQWPNKIKVYIVEHVPVAHWNYLHMMLTKDAVILTVPVGQVHKKSFPMLFGPVGSERDVLINYYVFVQILKFGLILKSVGVDNRHSWHIILEDNTRLILGRKYYVERLRRFVKFYPIFLKQDMYKNDKCVNYNIDLRYESGFSVKTIPYK